MIVDANLLLYATDTTSLHHTRAVSWLTEVLNGNRRVGLPWQSLGAFVRIATHPRVTRHPLDADTAQNIVDSWLAAPAACARSTAHITAEHRRL